MWTLIVRIARRRFRATFFCARSRPGGRRTHGAMVSCACATCPLPGGHLCTGLLPGRSLSNHARQPATCKGYRRCRLQWTPNRISPRSRHIGSEKACTNGDATGPGRAGPGPITIATCLFPAYHIRSLRDRTWAWSGVAPSGALSPRRAIRKGHMRAPTLILIPGGWAGRKSSFWGF